jgi:hypothetical protein
MIKKNIAYGFLDLAEVLELLAEGILISVPS